MDLNLLVPALKRAVAPPGEFDTYFPNAMDQDLTGVLADAMAEAQLDGFLSKTSLDLTNEATTPDLTTPEQALVIFYGMARVLAAQMANIKNRTRYKAGNVEADTEQSASVIVELLREVTSRKAALIDQARTGDVGKAFYTVDMFVTKSIDISSTDVNYISYIDLEYGAYQALDTRF